MGRDGAEELKRKFRLKKPADFKRVRLIGKSISNPFLVVVFHPNDCNQTRIGVAAGRSIGNAVKRNRARRRLRSIANIVLSEIQSGWDIIFIARKPILTANFRAILSATIESLNRANIRELKHGNEN